MHDPVCFETFERLPGAEDERLLQANNTATACYCFIGTNGIPVPIRRGSALRGMAKEIPLVSSLQRRAFGSWKIINCCKHTMFYHAYITNREMAENNANHSIPTDRIGAEVSSGRCQGGMGGWPLCDGGNGR